jgi:hypothetical protein
VRALPAARPTDPANQRTVDTDFSVVAQFQAEFRGVAEYYRWRSTVIASAG